VNGAVLGEAPNVIPDSVAQPALVSGPNVGARSPGRLDEAARLAAATALRAMRSVSCGQPRDGVSGLHGLGDRPAGRVGGVQRTVSRTATTVGVTTVTR